MATQKIVHFKDEDAANEFIQKNFQWRAVNISTVCKVASSLKLSTSSSLSGDEYPYPDISSSYEVLVLFEYIE